MQILMQLSDHVLHSGFYFFCLTPRTRDKAVFAVVMFFILIIAFAKSADYTHFNIYFSTLASSHLFYLRIDDY